MADLRLRYVAQLLKHNSHLCSPPPFWIVCVVWLLTVNTIYLFNRLYLGAALHSPASILSVFHFAYDDAEVINEVHFVVNFLVIADELHRGCVMMSARWIPVLLRVIGLHVSCAAPVCEHYFCFFNCRHLEM
jgi:hypothetical protein